MFETPDHARAALTAHFEPQLAGALMRALVPAIVLAPVEDGTPARLGGSRLGGTPDLPPGLDWPRPAPPADPEVIASRGSEDAGAMMRRHIAADLPYAFVGQIDLEEAAALGQVAAPLPGEGRLLFFYDAVVGPWECDTRVARVIWDRSARDQLVASTMPRDLAAAAERDRRDAEEAGLAREPDPGGVHGAPARAVTLTPTFRLADPFALECEPVPELHGFPDPPDFAIRGAYRDLLDACDPVFPEAWRRHQLLGSPMPEYSDDPRCEAIESLDDIRTFASPDQRKVFFAGVLARAQTWLLLLQIDLGAWGDLQGTLYFVMPRVLVEDTHGKGHLSRHSAEAQTVIWISLPNGLDVPPA